MSNSFNSNLMPRILAGALRVLREEAVFAKMCTKDVSGAAGSLGQTVSIAVPSAQASYAITPAATAPSLVDATFVAKTVTIDQFRGSRFHLSTTDSVNYNLANSEIVPNQVAEAARKLARDVNQAIWGKYTKIYGWAGTATTNLFGSSINNLAAADQRLNQQLCPPDNRVLITTLAGRAAALQLDDVKKNPQLAGDPSAYRRASLGMIYGMEVFHDRDISSHTAGTGFSAAYINTAASIGGATIAVRAATGGFLQLQAGDIFTVSSDTTVYYTSTSAISLAAGESGTITLDRPLDAALAINETLSTPTGFASGYNYIAGDLSGYGLVMRVPAADGSIDGAPTLGPSMSMVDDVTGIPLKLTYIPGYHAAQWELSVLYGVDIIDGRRLIRVGSSV
jgi:hypothetical protein